MKKTGIIIRNLVFIVILTFVLVKVSDILEYKYGSKKCDTFIEKSDEIDVVFLGTSHMINAVLPMELYNEYGITSYNMAFYSSRMPVVYHTLNNILDYCKPELVVLDIFTVEENIKVYENLEQLHRTLDGFPMSRKKIEAVNDLLDDFDQKVEFLFTGTKYHKRWNELKEDDFKIKYNVTKGSETHNKVYTGLEAYEVKMTDEQTVYDTIGTEYLIKIIELCKAENIEIMLTCIPYAYSEDVQKKYNYINQIAEKYDVNYYDIYKENIINYSVDMYDDTHMNASGAQKVSKAVGKYIKNQYDIKDHRGDNSYISWDKDYEQYLEENIKTINTYANTSIYTYLMLLNNNALECEISVGKDFDLNKDILLSKLINNISHCGEINVLDKGNSDITIVVKKVSTGEVVSKKSYIYKGDYVLLNK